ncbi:hypothetical protein [Corticibacter populi]|uniref:hypothetical protein n=1 Tax=Corticibacter populi TaxID=1550736 RepID=UPI000EFE8C4F|nr:hypothetical protein [Corticibacter populi]RZS31905.1 hypothetical protein EV687_2585 [Corticibacter populi]
MMDDQDRHARTLQLGSKAGCPQSPKQPLPRTPMPVPPAFGLMHVIGMAVWRYRRRRLFRRHLLPLLTLGDDLLGDLGYRRADLLWAARLPLRVDAIGALVERRRQRSARPAMRCRALPHACRGKA